MKKNKLSIRKKIIIYYVLAIVIPCIILGILALRGVKNDQALLEKEHRRELQDLGQRIITNLEDKFLLVESRYIQLLEKESGLSANQLSAETEILTFIDTIPIIDAAFYLSGNIDFTILNRKLLYKHNNQVQFDVFQPSAKLESILEEGDKLEYIQKDYVKAIRHYENSLKSITDPQERAKIYNSIAIVQRKLVRAEDAIITYDTLYSNYADYNIQGGFPLGMVALMESVNLYIKNQNYSGGIKNMNLLLNNILNIRWSINSPIYYNFISQLRTVVDDLEDSDNQADSLLNTARNYLESISKMEAKTAYLLNVTDLAKNINSSYQNNNENFRSRNTFLKDETSYFIFLTQNKLKRSGLIYNQEYFLQNIISNLIDNLTEESDFEWEIIDNFNQLLQSSIKLSPGIEPVKVSFPSSLPSWTLIMYPVSGSGLFLLIKSIEGIYFYIFILIVIILACGLFFTLSTVNNELRLSKMKSNFISTVSHEFKSPLTLIRQMAEMLEGGRVPSPERRQKYYSSMLQESERLSHLIDNILDFSKMEVGQKNFRFEKQSLSFIVEEAVSSYNNQWEHKGIKIEFILPDPIEDLVFDSNAIKQVLLNLIDNACKYSRDSKIIEVKLTQNISKVILEVKDHGIGINKDEQDKIFSRFYRAGDDHTQKVKGSGIGLTIVKQIVEAHKGYINVESEPGKGSVFQIVLPLTK
ncbi:sensor histidine kinase [Bacteroidota bacterium]